VPLSGRKVKAPDVQLLDLHTDMSAKATVSSLDKSYSVYAET